MAFSTRVLMSRLTVLLPLRTRDTVPTETPASRATSLIVGSGAGVLAARLLGPPDSINPLLAPVRHRPAPEWSRSGDRPLGRKRAPSMKRFHGAPSCCNITYIGGSEPVGRASQASQSRRCPHGRPFVLQCGARRAPAGGD